ncbi:hypothetical protein KGQ55_03365 [Patescibacteria group bacterium]|nr:hypothetical protein [Patescibacteria group bacterium]
MSMLGKRIVVVGVSAAGKTTFAKALAERTKLPLVLMDAVMWKPGWNYIGDEATDARLHELSTAPEWIIEGYITTSARAFLFERADTVIYLDYAPHVNAWRYLKRWFMHRKRPRPELSGSPERFKASRLKLAWTKGEAKFLNANLARIDQTKLVTLSSSGDADEFLEELHSA